MAVLDEVSQWESVNKILDGEEVQAAHANLAPQNLTNRTRWLYDMISQAGMKRACRCATTAAISLSGTQVIDGVSVVAGDSVLVKNQPSQYENGVYVVAAGAWSRRFDADSTLDLNGGVVPVGGGSVNAHTIWMQQTAEPVIGTSAILFDKVYPVNLAHTHANDASIGGPYAGQSHGHSNDSGIGGPYAGQSHGHTNDASIGGPYAGQSHNHTNGSGIGGPFALAAGFDKILNNSGYAKIDGGLIIQWGQLASSGDVAFTFRIPFPNSCFVVVATPGATNIDTWNPQVRSFSAAGATIWVHPNNVPVCWVAFGY